MVQIEDESSIVRFFVSPDKKDYQLTLVPDTTYPKTYNFYTNVGTLSLMEVSALIKELIEFIPENHYVSCTGEQPLQTIKLFKTLSYNTFYWKDTCCVKIAVNKDTQERVALPILKKK